MKITANEVSRLRESTGLPLMACKKALVSSKGDQGKAVDILRKEYNSKISVAVYSGKSTGVYCFSGFRGNIIKENGAVCSQCNVFIDHKDIPSHERERHRTKSYWHIFDNAGYRSIK